jgi:hypothetical protein
MFMQEFTIEKNHSNRRGWFDLATDLKSTLESPKDSFSDIIVKVADAEFYLHRLLLVARSGYFKELLDNNISR